MAFCSLVDYFALLLILACLCETYASSYQEYTITNPKICSPTGKKGKIKLTENLDAAIVEETRSFDKWPGHVKFHCQFEVKDVRGDNEGLVFAVIQNLRFRESEGDCIDYVQFESEREKGDKICGEMSPAIAYELSSRSSSSEEDDDDDDLALNAFVALNEIKVTIHVAQERLPPGEDLDLKIAFTSARRCDTQGKGFFQSKSSSLTLPCFKRFCISSVYANDSIVNCPSFCKDEGGCAAYSNGPAFHRPSVGTKMTIGAVTTVLASFLLFFACIWVLRHYRKLCWSNDFSGQREVRMTPVPPAPTGLDSLEAGSTRQEPQSPPGILSVPSAPPLEAPVSTILPDKDLPPSYESLFPPTSR